MNNNENQFNLNNTLKGIELSDDDILIAKIQSMIRRLSYQYKETYFSNNNQDNDVIVCITKNDDPTIFSNVNENTQHNEQIVCWGRFNRLYAWTEALKHIINVENKLECTP